MHHGASSRRFDPGAPTGPALPAARRGGLRGHRRRRGRRRRRAGAVPGRASASCSWSRARICARPISTTTSSPPSSSKRSPTTTIPSRTPSGPRSRRRPRCRRSSSTPDWSAAARCTSPRTTGASTRSTSWSGAGRDRWTAPTMADWPITYADLEPYYSRVEWEVGVSGLAGASPFDPPRSRPYPVPPLPIKSTGVLTERAAEKLGWHAFPAPMAILSQPYRGRAACIQCGFCEQFGCEVGAKSSTPRGHDPRRRSDRAAARSAPSATSARSSWTGGDAPSA